MNVLAKKKFTYAVILSAVLILLCFLGTAINADIGIPPSRGEDPSGVVYEISKDETYVTIVGYCAWADSNIVIPSEIEGLPVTEIAKNAFTNQFELYSIVIPDSVVKIGDDAFRGCRTLLTVKLPAGLKELPMNCFYDCTVLDDLVLPEGLEVIGDFCFENCTMLGRLKIPASVTEIGYDAFVHCENVFLDVSENEYAAEYAVRYNVNTEYEGTSAYFWTVIGFSVFVALIFFFIIAMIYMSYLKKHPEKNPNIFIFRVLGKIYDALARLIELIKKAIVWVLTHILYALSVAKKWVKTKLAERKQRKAEKKNAEKLSEEDSKPVEVLKSEAETDAESDGRS